MGRLSTLFDVDDLIDPDFETYPALMDIKTKFKSKNSLLLLADGNGALNNSQACALTNWVSDQVLTRSDIELVVSTFQLRQTEFKNGSLSYPRYLKPECDKAAGHVSNAELNNSPWSGILTSSGDVAVQFDLSDTEKPNGPSFEPSAVPEFMASLTTWIKDKGIKVKWYGSTVFQYYMKLGYDQTAQLNILIVLFIFIFFKLSFGTLKSSVIFLLSLGFVNLFLHGFMATVGYPIDVLTNSMFLMLTIATIEDFIYLSHLQQIDMHSWRNDFRKLILPSFLTTLTTAVGFGSLAVSELGIIRRFGIVSALGAMAEWVAIFMLLPALAQIWPALRVWTAKGTKPPLSKLKGIATKTPARWFALASLLFFLIGGYGSTKLHIDDTPHELFPAGHPMNQAVDYLRQSRGWEASADVLLTPSANEKKILAALKSNPMIVRMESASLYVDHFTKDVPLSYKKLVEEEVTSAPVYARYAADDGSRRIILYLNKTDIQDVNKLRDFVNQICTKGECSLGGSLVSYAEFGNRVATTLLESLTSSILMVSLILLFLAIARREKDWFAVLASSMWGPAFLIAILYLAQVKIYFVTTIFASVVVGLAGDNAIQYLFAAKPNRLAKGVHNFALPSLYLGICMMLIPAVFLLSHFNPMRSLGALFIVGAAASVFGDLWILKGLLRNRS